MTIFTKPPEEFQWVLLTDSVNQIIKPQVDREKKFTCKFWQEFEKKKKKKKKERKKDTLASSPSVKNIRISPQLLLLQNLM